jgi:LmbE family N-acetylglucosaminyl deacetylase
MVLLVIFHRHPIMIFSKKTASTFIPDSSTTAQALARTTHMAIGAHADDIEFFAYHGIAACYEQADQWFTGVTVTNGAGSVCAGPYAQKSVTELIQIRKKEQEEAARVGKYSAILQLDYSSEEVKDPRQSSHLVDDLFQLLDAARPRTLYLHNPADKHETHVAVLIRSITALRKLKISDRPTQVYGCEVWRDLDWLTDLDKVALSTSSRPELQESLNNLFDSQIAGGKRYDLAVMARRRAHATFFDSHSVDTESGLTYAVDLTPLMKEDSLNLEDFMASKMEAFIQDVLQKLKKFAA